MNRRVFHDTLTTLRLGKYFGVSAEIWMGLPSGYGLRVARRTSRKKVEKRVAVHEP